MNAEVRAIKTSAEQALVSAYEAARAALPGKGAVAALRDEAGQALDVALRAHGAPAREVRAQPIRWMPRVRSAHADKG